jgi:hypothetical protein
MSLVLARPAWRHSAGSILAATGAVVLAGLTGLRHLRSMLTEHNFRVLQLDSDDYTYIR